MEETRKDRLVGVGAEVLANALLKLATHDEMADELVERLTATPQEALKRVRAKLAGLKRMRRFVPWDEAPAFAHQLESLLEDLKAGVEDPRHGAELVVAFYETDGKVFECCDDSSGLVGNVFRYDAKNLFVSYASRCDDKVWLGQLVLKLNQQDDYGVRDSLIHCALEYLPEPNIRKLIELLQEQGKFGKGHPLMLIESLARQIKDAPLFEKTRLTSWETLSPSSCLDIASVYLESDDAAAALSWLQRIPADEIRSRWHMRDQLLFEIYSRLGDQEKLGSVAWRLFRVHRSSNSLNRLLAVIGEKQKEQVIYGEVDIILSQKNLSLSDATFLIEMGRMNEAEDYLLNRVEQLDGDQYVQLLPLAEAMETNERILTATILYRALLDSILRRAQTKTYSHGVRYLKKLDKLAESVQNWKQINSHSAYLQQLKQNHGRKSSFWAKYEK